jgi:hypothetical protein
MRHELDLTAAVEAWAEFPAMAEPRPLVLVEPPIHEAGYSNAEAKTAFAEGRIVVDSTVAAEAVAALVMATGVGLKGGEPRLRLERAVPVVHTFGTDRGRQVLAAWQLHVHQSLGPVGVLRAADQARAWRPSGWSADQTWWPGAQATLSEGGNTVEFEFSGSPTAYTDFPDARVIETAVAVAIAPVAVERAGVTVRQLYAQTRRVTVQLARPLGNRVLLTSVGKPVPVVTS